MRTTLSILLSLALLGPAALAIAQKYEQAVDLRESPFFEGEVTFSTPAGERTLKVTLKQLQLNGHVRVELPLPDRGMVVLQHRAGDVTLSAGRTEFEPLEGEWITIDLPEGVTLSTEDDAGLVDAIVIAE